MTNVEMICTAVYGCVCVLALLAFFITAFIYDYKMEVSGGFDSQLIRRMYVRYIRALRKKYGSTYYYEKLHEEENEECLRQSSDI